MVLPVLSIFVTISREALGYRNLVVTFFIRIPIGPLISSHFVKIKTQKENYILRCMSRARNHLGIFLSKTPSSYQANTSNKVEQKGTH